MKTPTCCALRGIWLGLLCALICHQAAVKGAEVPPRADSFAGTWRGTIKMGGNNVNFVWVCDGRAFQTFVEGQPAPFTAGAFAVVNGKWKTTPAYGAPADEGAFRFIDADRVAMTGKAGVEVTWVRVKAAGGAGNAGGVGQGAAQVAGAAEPVGSGGLDDFAAVKQQASAIARRWNAGSQLFRVDAWGAYSSSRFKAVGMRFFYFVLKERGALEVRADAKALQGMAYPAEFSADPQSISEKCLSPEDALRRLWDLAPTVRHDQVYLQLLNVGVEKSGSGAATSWPLPAFLKQFPVTFADGEKEAPRDRAVWRMAAVRDHDVILDKAYGAFIYIDAASGEALSRRIPATGVQIFMRHGLCPPSPIGPYPIPEGPIPLDSPAEQVGTFAPLAVGQKAESINLTLRQLVRDGRSEREIRAAVDKLCAWAEQIEQVRREDAARGLAVLQEAAQKDPGNIARQTALFKRYVDEIEKEKRAALASNAVVMISRTNRSEFWLQNQFQISEACLGTRNQSHVVLDTRSGQWIYKMADPPSTGVISRYYRPATQTLLAIRNTGRNDYELERQITRFHLLIGGNQEALGTGDSLSPIDPLQLMVYAEYNRVRGSEKMLEAARLRLPKSWSKTTERDLGDKIEVTTTTYTRAPTAGELAAADRLDAVAKGQDAPRVAAVQDLALKLQPLDPRIFFLWSRVEANFYDVQLADRVAMRGLMIDPGCAELYAVRVLAWMKHKEINKANVFCAEKFAGSYTAADLMDGPPIAEMDKIAGYFVTLQRLRLAPDDLASHGVLCEVLWRLSGLSVNQNEFMPDAREQRQRELGVAAVMMSRLMERPADWSKAVPKGMPVTRENLARVHADFYAMRGDELMTLKRIDEARECFKRALSIDPQNRTARNGLKG